MPPPPPSQLVYCNSCQHETAHACLKTIERPLWLLEAYEVDPSVTFEVLQCRGCHDVVVRRSIFVRHPKDRDVPDVRYFPPPMSRRLPEWRHKLPEEFRPLLEEIYRSLDAENLRLPMMGARALVDM